MRKKVEFKNFNVVESLTGKLLGTVVARNFSEALRKAEIRFGTWIVVK